MKTIIKIVVIVLTLINSASAQDTITSKTTCIKKGDVIVEGYWGGPFILGSAGILGKKKYNTQHFGFKTEYLSSNKLGVGIELSYAEAKSVAPYFYTGIKFGYIDEKVTTFLTDKQSATKLRILVNCSKHRLRAKSDWYLTYGLGVKVVKTEKIYTERFNFEYSQSEPYLPKQKIGFSGRLAIGYKYFFNNGLGLNFETGIGGAFLQAGLTYKLTNQYKNVHAIDLKVKAVKSNFKKGVKKLQDSTLVNKCVKKDDVIIDVFFGDYLPEADAKIACDNISSYENIKVHNTNYNHYGVRAEYIRKSKHSLGFEYTYAQFNQTLVGWEIPYGGTRTAINKTDKYVKRRFVLKHTYHIGKFKKIDPYITHGIGYKTLTVNDWSISNEWTSCSANSFFCISTPISLPIAIRLGYGVRYFFNDHIGINAEAGIGGPLVQGGISFKF